MRPPINFLKYDSNRDTDILQEYFIPLDEFPSFMESLKLILVDHNVNLLSISLRYVRNNTDSILSYSNKNSIAVVLYINIGLSSDEIRYARDWTRKIVESALNSNGNYYLIYQRFPTVVQFQEAYPRWKEFVHTKNTYDAEMLFNNQFYNTYFQNPYSKELQQTNR